MTPLELELLTLLKPAAQKVFTDYVIPDLKGLEDKIGNEAVKTVIESITASLESLGQAALAAA